MVNVPCPVTTHRQLFTNAHDDPSISTPTIMCLPVRSSLIQSWERRLDVNDGCPVECLQWTDPDISRFLDLQDLNSVQADRIRPIR